MDIPTKGEVLEEMFNGTIFHVKNLTFGIFLIFCFLKNTLKSKIILLYNNINE